MSSKKKGLSLEDKRKKMIELFYETKDVYLLKDLEKLAPKLKGITSMSVKDVVTSLVDDGMVDTDKIGTSVYFWAFPSKASANRKRKLASLNNQISNVEKKAKLAESELSSANEGREDSDERDDILQRLTEAEILHEKLLASLKQYADNDPAALKEKELETKRAQDCANRWTDNIYSMQGWVKKNFPNISVDMFNKQFEIPEDLDYIQ